MQVPIDYPAATTVVCLAGCVNRRALIQPKQVDMSWRIVPNLWGGIIAPPGFLKTPVIHEISRPLRDIEDEWRREHEAKLKECKRAQEEIELRRSAWKEEFKKCHKKHQEAPPRPDDDELEEPPMKRLMVNDSTFEKLHLIMSENSAGVLVMRDELTGWWSTLDRPGREGERAFCLEAWNGTNPFTIDRIGRGTIYVPACCMSMFGGRGVSA